MFGRQVISLTLSGGYTHICKDTVRVIEGFVGELILDLTLVEGCSFGFCSVDEEDESDDRE
jgi:hypothetical protein